MHYLFCKWTLNKVYLMYYFLGEFIHNLLRNNYIIHGGIVSNTLSSWQLHRLYTIRGRAVCWLIMQVKMSTEASPVNRIKYSILNVSKIIFSIELYLNGNTGIRFQSWQQLVEFSVVCNSRMKRAFVSVFV